MKNKYIFIRIAGIAFLILLIVVYFILYFVPTIKEISFQKRQLKDMNLKIADFVKMENTFSFSNDQERALFAASKEELAQRIPQVYQREDYIALFTRVSQYVQQLAKTDGIFNLVFTSDSQEMQVETGSLAVNKKSLDQLLLFSSQRLSALKQQLGSAYQATGFVSGGLATLVPGLQYHTVWLSFSAEMPSALHFINHIPRYNALLSEDKILIATAAGTPNFLMSLKIYYRDFRNQPNTGKKP